MTPEERRDKDEQQEGAFPDAGVSDQEQRARMPARDPLDTQYNALRPDEALDEAEQRKRRHESRAKDDVLENEAQTDPHPMPGNVDDDHPHRRRATRHHDDKAKPADKTKPADTPKRDDAPKSDVAAPAPASDPLGPGWLTPKADKDRS